MELVQDRVQRWDFFISGVETSGSVLVCLLIS